jgi:hypothetical protein
MRVSSATGAADRGGPYDSQRKPTDPRSRIHSRVAARISPAGACKAMPTLSSTYLPRVMCGHWNVRGLALGSSPSCH